MFPIGPGNLSSSVCVWSQVAKSCCRLPAGAHFYGIISSTTWTDNRPDYVVAAYVHSLPESRYRTVNRLWLWSSLSSVYNG